MGKIKFSDADVKSGYLIKQPAWITYEVKRHTEKPSSTDGRPVHFITFEGKDGELAEVQVLKTFAEAALWAAVPFFRACNGGQDLVSGKDYDFDETLNCIIQGYTQRGTLKGNAINEIVDFRPKKS